MEKKNNAKEITKTIKLEIFRYHPEEGGNPTFNTYEIPFHEDWAILDDINYLDELIDTGQISSNSLDKFFVNYQRQVDDINDIDLIDIVLEYYKDRTKWLKPKQFRSIYT